LAEHKEKKLTNVNGERKNSMLNRAVPGTWGVSKRRGGKAPDRGKERNHILAPTEKKRSKCQSKKMKNHGALKPPENAPNHGRYVKNLVENTTQGHCVKKKDFPGKKE